MPVKKKLPGGGERTGEIPELEKYSSGSKIPPKFIEGTPEMVQQQLEDLSKDFSLEEKMIQDMMTGHGARLHSYELMAQIISWLKHV